MCALLCHVVVVAVEDRGGSRGVTSMRKVKVVSVLATFVSGDKRQKKKYSFIGECVELIATERRVFALAPYLTEASVSDTTTLCS